ncbi:MULTISPECIES: methylmalonyl Co-A mutase-associated GTPase MeaB [unclassified Bradyrhizobium]|uniref:methylmalonyl Co-A mutase-associated GTPase MeaB n=1 Tax=unclassified Bradyrhizobium TaxID=2631580 RepID=UPI001BA927AC|nr:MULTISPECIES: methylmalonyl Co-A mutase-associated GTPase MeaB [unclassified Bradyrhizobium]MBR1203003.1 methylmalonyl Co-A mutase-associated GTPase MeaB [Bradyrhizobium sp. AUGA SZCCT0124]MBR1314418.1 methylmalonyl Co-A mutase-associated GTPase MeaB [Bradyrhizobium sp. AUGA SZCCT0051]MBR1342564.1 methylmalonyl Co-A mutase-associated GTPase MeaB [Bradyrhizobium sp. AUGA SZCCT0105]MBR1352794.1 methylmalonyl Co-A mutase-associated GTPase MeaB [Bradyrhizobium sp. AUGA SZCCT0045]
MTSDSIATSLLVRLRAGDAKAIARAITIAEAGGAAAASLHRAVLPQTGSALTVGFTGPPGAGKSTLIDTFVAELRRSGKTVAVAAVDPSSPLSGGAVLGDRVRMGRHTEDAGVFIRSIASRGHLGGLTDSIQPIVDILDFAGRDVIVIETVGAGQSEVEIVEVADVRVVVNAPGLGDDIQAIKAGILEIANVLVVNKADLPLAARTVRQLRSMLSLRRETDRNVPVIETVASSGQGVVELVEAVFNVAPRTPAERQARRRARIHRLLAETAAAEIRRSILERTDEPFVNMLRQVEAGEVSIDTATRAALGSHHEAHDHVSNSHTSGSRRDEPVT